MMNKTKYNFWLDATISVAFLITATTGLLLWWVIPHGSGFAFPWFSRNGWVIFHICSGMVSLGGAVLHVAWHRDWLKSLRGRPLSGMSEKLRANRIVDRILWITFIAANVSGALAWIIHFGDDIYVVTIPDRLHVVVGIVLIFLVTVHFAFHWKWIASTTRRYIQVNSHYISDFQRILLDL